MEPLRVAGIGRTGRGDWGHAIDELWRDLEAADVVAVADEDEEGLGKAVARLKLDATKPGTAHRDWRAMLDTVRPDIVAICMRHLDCHAEMAIAAAEAGAKGIFMEKPFVRTPAEADAVIAACTKSSTKLALAFVNRHSPAYAAARDLIEDGRIGKVLELRGRGKEDKRGGGEDLWVLGSHVLDMLADLGGAPQWCEAAVTLDGRPITKADAAEAPEGLGLIAGDSVAATRGHGWGDPHPPRLRAPRLFPGGAALADGQGLSLAADRARGARLTVAGGRRRPGGGAGELGPPSRG